MNTRRAKRHTRVTDVSSTRAHDAACAQTHFRTKEMPSSPDSSNRENASSSITRARTRQRKPTQLHPSNNGDTCWENRLGGRDASCNCVIVTG